MMPLRPASTTPPDHAAPQPLHGQWVSDHPILAIERIRATALVEQDLATIDHLVSEGLVYIHATGLMHDKPAYLDYLRTGPRFLKVQVTEPRAWDMGKVLLLQGSLQLIFERPGQPQTETQSLITQTWTQGAGHWQLLAFQSTRLA